MASCLQWYYIHELLCVRADASLAVLDWFDYLYSVPYVHPTKCLKKHHLRWSEAKWGMGQHIRDLNEDDMQKSLKVNIYKRPNHAMLTKSRLFGHP